MPNFLNDAKQVLLDSGYRPDDLDLLNQDQSPFTVNQSYKNNDAKQVLIDSGVRPQMLIEYQYLAHLL